MFDRLNVLLGGMFARFATVLSRVRSERGQDLIEYALLGGLIAAAIIAVGALAYEGALNSMAAGISACVDFKSTTTCSPF